MQNDIINYDVDCTMPLCTSFTMNFFLTSFTFLSD